MSAALTHLRSAVCDQRFVGTYAAYPAESQAMQLTPAELKVCRLMGHTPEDFKKEKLRLAALNAAEASAQRESVSTPGLALLSSEDRAAALQLTAADLHVCRLGGHSPAEYLKTKQALASTAEE